MCHESVSSKLFTGPRSSSVRAATRAAPLSIIATRARLDLQPSCQGKTVVSTHRSLPVSAHTGGSGYSFTAKAGTDLLHCCNEALQPCHCSGVRKVIRRPPGAGQGKRGKLVMSQ